VKIEEPDDGEIVPPPPPPPPPEPPSGMDDRNGDFDRFENVQVKTEKVPFDQNVPIPASYE